MKYRRRDLPFQVIGDQTFVVEPREGILHMLDETAGYLWTRLERPEDAKGLAGALCEEYEVDEETAARDAAAFLKELESKGLVGAA